MRTAFAGLALLVSAMFRLLLLASLLTACAPEEKRCEPEAIGERGDLPRFNVSNVAFSPPIGLVGLPLALTVFAPRSVCDFEVPVLSARVELSGPDFELPSVTVSTPRVVTAIAESRGPPEPVEAVSVEVAFTPPQPGQYMMRVVFEPSLGARWLLLYVAEPRIDPPSVRITVPNWSACVDQPWAVSADAVACERDTKRVEVYFADGGVSSFPGEQLVVAGPVLWSVASATGRLERHRVVDGGLALTDAFAGFSTRTVRGMHDERSALRALNSGALVVAAIESPLVDLHSRSGSGTGSLLFAEGESLHAETPCAIEGCFGLLGLEPSMLWKVEQQGAGVSGFRRPLGADQIGSDLVLRRKASLLTAAPERGFERVPMWLPLTGTGLSALVNSDRLFFGFTAWNREEVVRVGKEFVLLEDQGDVLRVTPR